MAHYNLQPNESFVLGSEHVHRGNSSGELVLTNLNLVFITSKGVFKTTYIPQLYPLNQIKIFNGKANVVAGKAGNIEIFFVNGNESFRFWNTDTLFSDKKAEKEAAKWVDAINQVLTGQASDISSSGNSALTGTEFIAGSLKDTFDTVKGAFGIKGKNDKPPEKLAKKCNSCGAPISGVKGQVTRCQYCNADQQL
jgi:hypothetical protein